MSNSWESGTSVVRTNFDFCSSTLGVSAFEGNQELSPLPTLPIFYLTFSSSYCGTSFTLSAIKLPRADATPGVKSQGALKQVVPCAVLDNVLHSKVPSLLSESLADVIFSAMD